MNGWKINRWICWLGSVWGGWPFDYHIDGCSWVDKEEHRNCTVMIAECERCGKTDISWSKFAPKEK